MYIKEYMHTNVITVSSDTLIHDAEKIMRDRKIRRLPVVDQGKLVGIITRDRMREIRTSQAVPLSVWELNYLLAKMKVEDMMEKDVMTVTPDTTLEEGLALAQERGIGTLPVLEGKRLVGIITTTDIYKFGAQIFGFGKPGVRLHIFECCKTGSLTEVVDIISKSGGTIHSLFHVTPPGIGREDCIIHLDTKDAAQIIRELQAKGYEVEERAV